MKIENISDLRMGDVVRKDGKAFVVANVVGNQATVTRSHVITVPEGWEVVWRATVVGKVERLEARIRELEEEQPKKTKAKKNGR